MHLRYYQLLLGLLVLISQPAKAIATPLETITLKKNNQKQETIIQSSVFSLTVTITKLPGLINKVNSVTFLARSKQNTESNSSFNLFQQLNLTPQQKVQIRQISRRYQGQILHLKQELQVAQQQLATMMAGTDSVAVIRAKHEEIARYRQKLGELHFESMLATREVLTPQQRQKFAEIIEAK